MATKDNFIKLRISSEEKEALKKTALENGLDLSELIRLRLDNLPVIDRKYKNDLFQLILELSQEINPIGNNMNQLTKVVHQLQMQNIKDIQQYPLNDFNLCYKNFRQLMDTFYERVNSLLKDE